MMNITITATTKNNNYITIEMPYTADLDDFLWEIEETAGINYETIVISNDNTNKEIEYNGINYNLLIDLNYAIEAINSVIDQYTYKDENPFLYAFLEMEGMDIDSVESIIKLGDRLSDSPEFVFLPDVQDSYALGEYYVTELGMLSELPKNLQYYFDFESFGRDVSIEEGGCFTEYGYIVQIG